jgi:hypothetical protein
MKKNHKIKIKLKTPIHDKKIEHVEFFNTFFYIKLRDKSRYLILQHKLFN